MPLINVTINGRSYEMACGDGQEAHLRDLASRVSGRVTQLAQANGPIDEARLLAMASILLADDLRVEQAAHADTRQKLATAQNAVEQSAADNGGSIEQATAYIADVFEDVSKRLESVVDALEAE